MALVLLVVAAPRRLGRPADYAERMIIENGHDAAICGFHLNAFSSELSLNVDVDTTLTVLVGNCKRPARPEAGSIRVRHPRPGSDATFRYHGTVTRRRRPRARRSWPYVPTTHPCSSTSAFPNSTSRSCGGAARPAVRLSRPAEPQDGYWNEPSRGSRLIRAQSDSETGECHTSTLDLSSSRSSRRGM